MKTSSLLLSIAFVLFLFGCSSDDTPMANEPDNNFDEYLGTYDINLTQISGIYTFHDSIGNVIGQGLDTVEHLDVVLTISKYDEDSDTLLLSGLITSYPNGSRDVQGVVSNETIQIIYEETGASTKNDYIRGNIRLEGDSIYLDYLWNRSDNWSSEALPEYGNLLGSGSK